MRVPVEATGIDYSLFDFQILVWQKNVGDTVRRGEVLLSYETQKGNFDLAAEQNGVLAEILYLAGSEIERPADAPTGGWGKVLGYIETDSSMPITPEKGKSVKIPKAVEKPVAEKPKPIVPVDAPKDEPKEKMRVRMKLDGTFEKIGERKEEEQLQNIPHGDSGVKASPLVRSRARFRSVELSHVTPSGHENTITLEDVERAASGPKPAASEKPLDMPDDYSLVPLSLRRRGIAENMEKSWKEIPHARTSVIVDFSSVAELRRTWSLTHSGDNSDAVKKKTRWDVFVLYAMVHNIRQNWPIINSTFTWDGIRIHTHINMGISLGDKDGLLVPVIHNAEHLNMQGLAAALDELYKKFAEHKLGSRDYKNGTITFNNAGALRSSVYSPEGGGGDDGFSILPYAGGSAIVALHRIVANKANLGISFDHRAYDGREASGFLMDVKFVLEHIERFIQ